MATFGQLARFPAVVPISVPASSTILRGQAVTIDTGTHLARVIGATGEKLMGFATSDADTDVLQVWVAAGKGGYTVWIKPSTGLTLNVGDLMYVNSTALDGTFTNVAGTGVGATILGWLVDNKPDAYGCVEMAFISA